MTVEGKLILLIAVGMAAVTLACGVDEGKARPGTRAGEAGVTSSRRLAGPYLRAVGTVQDGGLPHAACSCERCELARRDPSAARRVASLAVVLPGSGRVYLIDATPDLPEQLAALADVRPGPRGRVDRDPLDGIFLTHAHMGHYLGLAHLGYEVVHAQGLPVWCTPRMAGFLRDNGPWSQLVELGNITPRELDLSGDGRARVELGDGVVAEAVPVPHRDEYTDTVGFRLEGPGRTVLYVPDIDSWEAWGDRMEAVFDGVDVAIVDGTFFSADELPGREASAIGHPMIADSLERFAPAVEAGELTVYFTHLNHSNPALDPVSPERQRLEAAGFAVLAEGEQIPL